MLRATGIGSCLTACRARLDYRDPIDLGDAVELAAWEADGRSLLAFEVGEKVRAVAARRAARIP